MRIALVTVIFFGILTLWIPAYWPTTIFQLGIFVMAISIGIPELGRTWNVISYGHQEAAYCTTTKTISFSSLYPALPLSFAVLWGLLQWAYGVTVYPFETEVAIVNWATLLAVFLISVQLFQNERTRSWCRSAMLWFGFAIAIIATVQTFSSGGKVFWLFPSGYTDYVMGPFVNRNLYSTFIEIVLPIAVYEALRNRNDSLVYSGVSAVMYASVIASASRAGTVLVTAESLAVVLLMWSSGRASTRAIASGAIRIGMFFLIFVAVVGWESVWSRFWQPDPMYIRRELNISSLHMIEAHPWMGVGLGTWPTAYPRYAIIDIGAFANQAHNDWLQWAAEGGIPFFVMLSTLFFWSLRPAIRSIWGLGTIAFFLHAIVDYPFSRSALGSWAVLAWALLAMEYDPQWFHINTSRTYDRCSLHHSKDISGAVQIGKCSIIRRTYCECETHVLSPLSYSFRR